MMRPNALLAIALPAVVALVPAHAGELPLSCEQDPCEAGVEATYLGQGLGTVQRVGREIRIKTAAKMVRLVDGVTEGVGRRYYYCGLQAGFHVFMTISEDREFSGVLVEAQSGRLLPGGYSVVMMADRSRYLAMVHPDGLEGEEWLVYSGVGKKEWSGFSFVPPADQNGEILYRLQNPRWSVQGLLQADASCLYDGSENTWPVRLGEDGRWAPLRQCVQGDPR